MVPHHQHQLHLTCAQSCSAIFHFLLSMRNTALHDKRRRRRCNQSDKIVVHHLVAYNGRWHACRVSMHCGSVAAIAAAAAAATYCCW